ncbi:DNA primase [Novosphingopyxis sp.]|uniref:DNA primase n=1 Tax=Novosphingopyxis sp. TaxID=2709690 RepID=UPI003B5A4C56
MTLSPQWLDQLKDRTSLSSLIGRSIKLTKAGREYKACCPFHNEKTPSFTVSEEKGFYHCFGCQKHGSAIDWMIDYAGLDFMDAVKALADEAGMDVPAPDPQAAQRAEKRASLHDVMAAAQERFVARLTDVGGSRAREYLSARGLKPETLTAFGFGFAPDERGGIAGDLKDIETKDLIEGGMLIDVEGKQPYDRFRGRVMIPIRDIRGRVIAFGGRVLGDGEPKYLNSPDTPLFDKGRTLYNLDKAAPAARQTGRMIVVEGYMDAIALAQAGFADVVAPLGTALTETQIELLWKQVECPVLCFDGDSAGQRAAFRAATRALPLLRPGHSLAFATLPAGQDPDDLLRSAGRNAFAELLERAEPLVERLWNHERAAAPLATPEQRAALKARLNEHVRTIHDDDIRHHYNHAFRERLDTLFAPSPRRYEGGRFGGGRFDGRRQGQARRGPWKPPPGPVSAALKGLNSASFDHHIVRAVIAGLERFPDIAQSHFEMLGDYHPADAALARRLDALLHPPSSPLRGVDPKGSYPISTDAELYNRAQGPIGAEPLIFSFNRQTLPGAAPLGDEERAKRDLCEAIRVMVERPAIEAALERATRAAETNLTDDSYAEQQRLRAVREEFDRRLADLMQEQDV